MPALDIDLDSGASQQPPPQDQQKTWGDYWQNAKIGTHQFAADMSAAAEYLGQVTGADELSRSANRERQRQNIYAEQNEEEMSPAGQKGLHAAITSKEFWEQPFSNGLLKATGFAPAMVAAAIPGGLLSSAMAGAATFGVQNAGGQLNDFYSKIDNASEDELNQSAMYRGLRSHMDEPEARAAFSAQMEGPLRPVVNFLLGAAAGYAGPGALMGAKTFGGSFGRRLATGVTTDAGLGALQAGGADASTQTALQEANQQKSFDPEQLAHAVAEGVAGMAPFGAAHALRGHGPEPQPKPAAVDTGEAKGATPESNTPQQLALPPPSVANRPHAEGTINVEPTSYGQIGEEPPDITAQQNAPATTGQQTTANPVVQRGNQPVKSGGQQLPSPPPNAKVPEEQARKQGEIGNPQNETTSRVPSDQAKESKRATGQLTPDEVQPGMPDPAQRAALTPKDVEDIKSSMGVRRQEGPARPEDLSQYRRERTQEAPLPAAPDVHLGRLVHEDVSDEHLGRLFDEDASGDASEPETKPLLTPEGKPFREQVEEHLANREQAQQQAEHKANLPSQQKEHRSNVQRDAKTARQDAMREVVEAHPPVENESDQSMVERARSMVDAADKIEGLDLNKGLRGTKNKPTAEHLTLKEADDLTKATQKKWWGKDQKKTTEALNRFRDRDASARAGKHEEVLSERRTEGEDAKRAQQRNVETMGSTATSSENIPVRIGEGNEAKPVAIPGLKGKHYRARAAEKGKPTLESNAEESAPHQPGETGIKEAPKLSKGKQKAAEIKADKAKKTAATLEAARKKRLESGRSGVDDVYEAVRKGEMSPADAVDRLHEIFPKSDSNPAQKQALAREVKKIKDLELATRTEKAEREGKSTFKGPMVEEASVGEKHETKEEQLETAADKFLEGKTGEAKATAEKFTPKVKAIKEKIASKKTAKPIFRPPGERSRDNRRPVRTMSFKEERAPLKRRDLKISQFERDIGEGREPSTQSDILEAGLKKTQGGPAPGETPPPMRQALNAAFHGHEGAIHDYVERPTEAALNWARKFGNNKIINALTPVYNFAQGVKHLVPLSPRIADTIEKMGAFTRDARQEGHGLIIRMIKAAHANPDNFHDFSRLINDQTMRGVRADSELGSGENAHLGLSKENQEKIAKGTYSPEQAALSDWAQRAVHGELKSRYQEMISKQPELGQLMKDWFEYTHDTQSDFAGEHINQILKAKGVSGDDLYKQTHTLTRKVSEAQYKHIAESLGEDTVDAIKAAKQLQTGRGPYSPLSRYGDWVVHGEYKYDRPTNAVKSAPEAHTYEFNTRKEAHDFVVQNAEHNPDISIRRYDPETGAHIPDLEDAKAKGATERYEVQIDPRHIEFHESEAEARERQKELKESGLLKREPPVEQRREYFRKTGEVTGTDIHNAMKELHKQTGYKAAKARGDKEVMRDMEQTVTNTLRRKSAGQKVRSASLPRRNVKGADTNLVRNATVYVDQMSKARARTRYMPAVEALLQNARRSMEQARYSGPHNSELNKDVTARSMAMEELDRRAHAEDPTENLGNLGRLLNVVNYIDRMARPMHLILHQTHLPMITLPHIGGRHGFMSAYKEAARAMGNLGMSVHGKGGMDFLNSLRDPLHENTNFGEFIRSKFKNDADYKGVDAMWKELESTGDIHPQAGFEVERYRPSNADTLKGKLETHVLGRADSAFRALTDSTEAVNRYVGSRVAYKLEYAKQIKAGKGAEEAQKLATDYARDTIVRTQGRYSGSNAAPLFKNRALRPFLQFRQFPLMMYHLLAHNANKAFRGATKEERMQGAASLAGIIGTHVAMTGLLGGLPLEIPKILAWFSKTMGITSSDWTDFENWQYEKMVGLAGKDGADWIMHGAGRKLFGADFHHRLGINSIIGTFGMPEYKYTPEKQLEWLTEFVTGAPGGLAKDVYQGSNELMNGDVVKGAARILPFQMLRDWHTAVAGGRKGTIEYTPGERVVRALGATPTREAELYERKDQLKGMKEQYNDQRNKLTRDWTGAKTGADKAKAFARIQNFNKGLPRDAQITMQALQSALKSKAPESGEDLKHHLGIAVGKTTKFLADRDRNLYAQ